MQRGNFKTLLGGAALVAVAMSATVAAALETAKPKDAHLFLGPAVIGSNYKVKPVVRSDGIMRIFNVETSYGEFQFDGVEFTKMRLRELDAVTALEKMSQSEAFVNAFGRAAIAPLQFGANLIVHPVDTINRSLSGVANMFDRAGAGLNNSRADRDQLLDSLLGVSDTQRQLAVGLGVDPYSDFPPLAEKLKQVAGAMAGGGLPVKAGLALIPGGVGITVSSASSVESAKDTLRDRTAAQIIAETRTILLSLGVPEDSTSRFVENRNYTPADLIIMARALAKLGAQNTVTFIDRAAEAASRDAAFYQRRRAELLAVRSAELGEIVSFITVAGRPLSLRRSGTVVAVFPFDDLAWTEIPQRGFNATTAALRRERPGDHPIFATTGTVTPMAAAELKKLGWKIVQIKPLR
jgi:hypothetical protein